jgi:hypothetical protein
MNCSFGCLLEGGGRVKLVAEGGQAFDFERDLECVGGAPASYAKFSAEIQEAHLVGGLTGAARLIAKRGVGMVNLCGA